MSLLRISNRAGAAALPTRHASAPLVNLKVSDRHDHGTGMRPYQGLDMRKVFFQKTWNPLSNKHIPDTKTQGYLYEHPYNARTHLHLTEDEQYKWFDNNFWWSKYTPAQLIKAASEFSKPFCYATFLLTVMFTPFAVLVLYNEQYEPKEDFMDRDEFFADFWWNYYGANYDAEKYRAYLEQRRAKKWRGVEFNEETYKGVYNFDHLASDRFVTSA